MDSSDKGVRRKRRVHNIPDNVDEAAIGAILEKLPIPCPKCGSSDTRTSAAKVGTLALYLKGALYRCRNCKRHFRVRADNTKVLMIVGTTAAGVVGLLAFIAINSVWDQAISAVNSIHISLPSFKRAQPGVQQETPESAQDDGPTGPKAEKLNKDVQTLYEKATSLAEQIPQVSALYRDAPSMYRSQLAQEKQKSGKKDVAKAVGDTEMTATRIDARLESQHKRAIASESEFRKDLASVMERVDKVMQACTKYRAAGKVSAQTLACDQFEGSISTLKVQVDAALDGLKGAEREYLSSRLVVDGIKAANHSITSSSAIPTTP